MTEDNPSGAAADSSGANIIELLNLRSRIADLFAEPADAAPGDKTRQAVHDATAALTEAISTYFYCPLELRPEATDLSAEPSLAESDGVSVSYTMAKSDNVVAMVLPRAAVRILVAACFGGLDKDPRIDVPEDFTKFELAFAEDFARRVLKAILRTIDPMLPDTLSLEEIAHVGSIAEALPTDGQKVQTSWSLQLDERLTCTIVTDVPTGLVSDDEDAPVEEEEEADNASDSTSWSDHMHTSLAATSVELRAIIDCPDRPLAEIRDMTIGSTLPLYDTNKTLAILECDGEPLFRCDIGQKDGQFAVSVINRIDQWNEFMDDLAVDADERTS